MFAILKSVILTGILLAQQPAADGERKVRPPVPDIKALQQLKVPKNVDQGGPAANRFQPVKPTIRPQEGRGPATVSPDRRPNMMTPVQPATPPPSGGKSRHMRMPEESTTTQEEGTLPFSGEEGGELKIEKEKKCKPVPPHVKQLMNFNDAEVSDIVQWISSQTCKNFIIADSIRGGKLTILSNTPVTVAEAYRAFLAALNVNNMTVVKVGEFHKLQMKRDAVKDTIPTYIGDEVDVPKLDSMVTRVVSLKFVDANTINGTVKQLCTKDGDSYPYAPTNTLIISDTGNNMYRLMEILKVLDTPLGQEEIRVIQVNFAAATELAQTLIEIFGDKGAGAPKAPGQRIQTIRPQGKGGEAPQPPGQMPGEGGGGEETVSLTKAIPDERTNKIVLVAASRSFPKIQQLINKLDVPIPGEGQIQVVYLEHASAEELSATLTALAQGTPGRPKPSATPHQPGQKPGGAPAQPAELFQGEVKVTSDKATNSLVIVANQNDFKSMLKVIKKLDIARRQVFVEAVIMEVNLDTTRDTGLAFHGGTALEVAGEKIPLFFGTQFKSGGQNMSSLNLLSAVQMLGFVSGLKGPDLTSDKSIVGSIALPAFGVLLQALQTDSNVNVLSTPHILTSDNEEAEIKVGENIPIPAGYGGGGLGSLAGLASMATQYGGTTGRPGTTNPYGGYGGGMGMMGGLLGGLGMGAINRQEVGLTLKIKPQINEVKVIRIVI